MTNLKSDLKRADELFENYGYHSALQLYIQALKKKPSDGQIKLKIAECYRKLNDWENAETWYAKIVANADIVQPVHLFYYAQALSNNKKYEEAKDWFNKYQQQSPTDSRAVNKVWGINHLDDFYRDSSLYVLKKLAINSPDSDFSPAYYREGIVFISAVGKELFVQHVYSWDNASLLDVYYSKVEPGGKLSKPHKFYNSVNTRYHEGPAVFYDNGRKMIFTRSNFLNGKLQKNEEGVNKISLFYAERDKNDKDWTNFKPLPFNNGNYSVGHPAISSDGKTLYFVSDMPGGSGGLDIYASRQEGATWSTPENLGPSVNTPGNEMFPFVHGDSVLYFSSDGYGGLGGLDVYKTELYGDQKFKIFNLGYPINTNSDDFAFIMDTVGTAGFFSSNRKGGVGSDDIYQFTVATLIVESILADVSDGRPITDATVRLVDSRTQKEIKGTERNGRYFFSVKPGENYILKSNKHKYVPSTVVVSTRNRKAGDTLSLQVKLERITPVSTPLVAEVYDPNNNQPIPGAKIYLLDEATSEEKYLTADEKGIFQFDALFVSSYAIIAEKDDKSGVVSSLVANDPEVLPNDTIRIPIYQFQPPAGEEVASTLYVEGLVIDVDNKESITGARVRLFEKDSQQEIKITEKDGKVSFEVKPGNYILKVDKDTYNNKAVVISTRSASSKKLQVKVQLEKIRPTSTPLIAYVFDPVSNKAQPNARIYLLNEVTSEEKYLSANEKGIFIFDALFNSSYAIIAEKNNRSGVVSSIIANDPAVLANDTVRIPIYASGTDPIYTPATPVAGWERKDTVQPPVDEKSEALTMYIQGEALDLDNSKALTGVTYRLFDANTRAEIQGIMRDNKVYFPVVPNENYLLKSSKDGHEQKTTIVSTKGHAPTDTLTVSVQLERIKPVSATQIVRLYDEKSGKPEAGAKIYLLNEVTSEEKYLTADDSGSFQFEALYTSSYAIIAEKDKKAGFLSSIAANPNVAKQEIIQIPMSEVSLKEEQAVVVIQPALTELETERDIVGATVKVFDGSTYKEIPGKMHNGKLIFEGHANANYIVKTRKPGFEDKIIIVSTKGNSAKDTVTANVIMEAVKPTTATILAHVYDETTGQSVPEAQIYLLDETTSEEKYLTADAKGDFRFEASLNASYAIIAEKGRKSGLLTGLLATESKGTLRIPVSEQIVSASNGIVSVSDKKEAADNKIVKVSNDKRNGTNLEKTNASSDAAASVHLLTVKNISGKEQLFLEYKGRMFEFKTAENLEYLSNVTDKQCWVIGQEEANKKVSIRARLDNALKACNIPVSATTKISNIFYDLNRSGIRDDATAQLNQLIELLKKHPTLKVEMKAYTDSRESYAYNDNLSARRVNAARLYLLSKGVNSNQVKTYFYGERYLVNECGNNIPCPESKHQQNRRTEFKLTY